MRRRLIRPSPPIRPIPAAARRRPLASPVRTILRLRRVSPSSASSTVAGSAPAPAHRATPVWLTAATPSRCAQSTGRQRRSHACNLHLDWSTLTPPDTQIDRQPAQSQRHHTATSPLHGTDGSGSGVAGFACQLDGGCIWRLHQPAELQRSGEWAATPSSAGRRCRRQSRPYPATYTWVVDITVPDTTPPDTTITAPRPIPAPPLRPTFSFSGT